MGVAGASPRAGDGGFESRTVHSSEGKWKATGKTEPALNGTEARATSKEGERSHLYGCGSTERVPKGFAREARFQG